MLPGSAALIDLYWHDFFQAWCTFIVFINALCAQEFKVIIQNIVAAIIAHAVFVLAYQ